MMLTIKKKEIQDRFHWFKYNDFDWLRRADFDWLRRADFDLLISI